MLVNDILTQNSCKTGKHKQMDYEKKIRFRLINFNDIKDGHKDRRMIYYT